MKTEKNMMKNGMTSTEVLVGVIIPFVLFWGGMLTPVFSDSVLVWIVGLFPFYGFMFVGQLSSSGNYIEIFARGSVMNVFTSVLLIVLLFLIPENWTGVGSVCRLAVLNIGPSLLLLFVSMAYRFYEGEDGNSLLVWPFL